MSEFLPTAMTSSQRLLLALLSCRPAAPFSGRENIRWDDFLRLAGGMGLAPFLAHVLQESPRALPDRVCEPILAAGRVNALRQLRRHAALRAIARSLDEARIPLIVLKGMALAYLAYPTPFCRSMSDVDLFVPRAEVKRAAELVAGCGFRESRNLFRQDCPPLVSSDNMVQVEVHGLLPSFEDLGAETDSLWSRSLPADLGGVQVRVLCPEDCIQHLCLHLGAHHHYLSRLLGLLDFRFYLEKYGGAVDWQALAGRSAQIGSSAWVYLTLSLARELLGAPVPQGFFQSCPAPKHLPELSRLATQHVLSLSDLPMASSFVRMCAGNSFKERWEAFADHWRGVGPRQERQNGGEATALGVGGYSRLLLRRMKFLVRAGGLRPSAWSAAAKYQASRAQLLSLMHNQAGSSSRHP